MILVDSSVWIDYFRGAVNAQATKLDELLHQEILAPTLRKSIYVQPCHTLVEIVVRGFFVYAFLLILLRITGKRQVGQLAPFDLVLLLVLSNAVQNSMTAGDNSPIGGLISGTTLVIVNYGVGIVTFRSKRLEAIIEGAPEC